MLLYILLTDTQVVESLRVHVASLSPLSRFVVALAAVLVVPPVCRRVKLPPVVGLLLAGIILGPFVLDIFGEQRPIADFFSDLGKLLLMFYAGLDVDLALFRQSQRKVTIFGLITTTLPLVLGTAVGLWFGYPRMVQKLKSCSLAIVKVQHSAESLAFSNRSI